MTHLSEIPNERGLSPLAVGAGVCFALAMVVLARIVELGGQTGLAAFLVAATAIVVLFATTWVRPDYGWAGYLLALPLYLVWIGQSRPTSDVGTSFTTMGAAKDVVLIVIVLASLKRILARGVAPMRSPLPLMTAVFLGVQLVYIVLSPQLLPALWAFRSTAEFAVVLFITPYVITDLPSLRRLINAFTLGSVLVVTISATAALQIGTVWVDAASGNVFGGVSAFGSYASRGSFSTFASLALLLALVLLTDPSLGRRSRAVNLYVVIASAISVLFTFERRAWLGVLVGLALLAILGRVRRGFVGWTLVVVALLGGLLAVSGSGVSEAVRARLTGDLSSPANAIRLNEWGEVIDRARDSFFVGEGLGTAGPTGATFEADDYVNSHSYYLLLLLETGIPGLLSFAAVVVAFLKQGRQSYQQRAEPGLQQSAALAAVICGINLLVQSFTTVGMAIFPFNYYFWLFGGILIVMPRLSDQPAQVVPDLQP